MIHGRIPATGTLIYAKDLEKVTTFYRRVLELEAIDAQDGFIVLAAQGMEVTIVRIPDERAAAVVIDEPPALREATPIKPIFGVANLIDTRRVAQRYGGGVLDADQEWEFRGRRVCDGWDPEGNVVQFSALMRR